LRGANGRPTRHVTAYGPGDAWPRHPKPWWRDALNVCRGEGWSLETFTDHGWGQVACPTGAHKITIFSTGRGSESVAQQASKTARRCAHLPDDQPGTSSGSPVEDAVARLGRASELVSRAEGQIEHARALALAGAHLELVLGDVVLALATAEATLDQLEADREAALDAVGALEPGPLLAEIVETLDEADAEVVAASGLAARDVGRIWRTRVADPAKTLANRVRIARERLDRI